MHADYPITFLSLSKYSVKIFAGILEIACWGFQNTIVEMN